MEQRNINEYFNLIENNTPNLLIEKVNDYTCILKNSNWDIFLWFILAKSKTWKAITICDIDFHPDEKWKFKPRLVFRRVNEKWEEKKVNWDKLVQRIPIDSSQNGNTEFWEMIYFLQSFKDTIDLGDFTNQFSVITSNDFIVWFKTKDIAEKILDINNIIDWANLSQIEIESLSKNLIYNKRVESLWIFEKMLWLEKDYIWGTIISKGDEKGKEFIEKYKKKYNLLQTWEEIAWHHFLKNNSWIIWLNVDLKFIEDFIDEAYVWNTDITWKWSPKVDMVGYSDYTVLIELKTANKNIFTEKKKKTSRTNTWSFSDDFIDWISQCLAQKSEHDRENKSIIVDKSWKKEKLSEVRTVDTDCIFIIWNKQREFPLNSSLCDDDIKKDTFKRFRENTKNIKIITFDELYERAVNILTLKNN